MAVSVVLAMMMPRVECDTNCCPVLDFALVWAVDRVPAAVGGGGDRCAYASITLGFTLNADVRMVAAAAALTVGYIAADDMASKQPAFAVASGWVLECSAILDFRSSTFGGYLGPMRDKG